MGGLALGGGLAGRRADALRRPLLVYGLLEGGVGLCALLALGVRALAGQVENDASTLQHVTGLIGTAVSGVFLFAIGLINRVVDSGAEREEALVFARKIAEKSSHIVKIGKEAFYRQAEMNLADAYRYASEVMVENLMARDAEEGLKAFIDKRAAKWEDR